MEKIVNILNYPPIISRELGLIKFYQRILANASDKNIPLLERLNFLCITSKNCDEFFEISYARLLKQNKDKPNKILDSGITVSNTLTLIRKELFDLHANIYKTYNSIILPELKNHGINFINMSSAKKEELKWIENYFHNNIISVLTPISTDLHHPFPKIRNKNLHFAVELQGIDQYGRNSELAIVIAPKSLPRVIKLPESITNTKNNFVLLQDIIIYHVNQLFLGLSVKGCYPFRVTRNSDISLKHNHHNISISITQEIQKRKYADCSRLELDISYDKPNQKIIDILSNHFNISNEDIYFSNGPVNLSRLNLIYELVDQKYLKYKYFDQKQIDITNQNNLLDTIKSKDLLIHSPYQSFNPVVELAKLAVLDPNVIAIKITLYRTKMNSKLTEYLINAAKLGKEVVVSIELLARFDEESNIKLAEELEKAGAHVVYGVMGYKVHSKMLLLIRKENNKLQKYAHIGTGNYNIETTKNYTDLNILTSKKEIIDDIELLFNQITGVTNNKHLKTIYQSPFNLFELLLKKINEEIINALNNKPAKIIAKMNSLTEKQIIMALYRASQAGVKIILIVRGACSLIPKIKGLSDNIEVRSVIGRFLEHHRIYYFYNNGKEDAYIASADWMQRNFFKRIEVCIPIIDNKVKKQIIKECITLYLKDTSNTWFMDNNCNYYKNHKKQFSIHDYLINHYCNNYDIISN
jgi:polyphosphate kinase